MDRIRILVTFGTRPEAIKMCPLINELRKFEDMEIIICLTGQHREMLDQVMDIFDIEADYDFHIMKECQTLFDITTGVMKGISEIIEKDKPDLVLVHGDTTTSYAAALASFYKAVPVGHVEAGLRTNDIKSPFPEEFNRRAVDMISDLLFAPTESAVNHLLSEGKSKDAITLTGNTVVDAIRFSISTEYMDENLRWAQCGRMILLTMHRRENLGQPMRNVFKTVRKVTDIYKDVKVIYPVHLNPAVRNVAYEILDGHERIRLIEPLDMLAFHHYMKNAYFIMTDSGGIQEEAPTLGKPVVVMRAQTERPESASAGVSCVVGTDCENVEAAMERLLNEDDVYKQMSQKKSLYGDGHASERIVRQIREHFSLRKD